MKYLPRSYELVELADQLRALEKAIREKVTSAESAVASTVLRRLQSELVGFVRELPRQNIESPSSEEVVHEVVRRIPILVELFVESIVAVFAPYPATYSVLVGPKLLDAFAALCNFCISIGLEPHRVSVWDLQVFVMARVLKVAAASLRDTITMDSYQLQYGQGRHLLKLQDDVDDLLECLSDIDCPLARKRMAAARVNAQCQTIGWGITMERHRTLHAITKPVWMANRVLTAWAQESRKTASSAKRTEGAASNHGASISD